MGLFSRSKSAGGQSGSWTPSRDDDPDDLTEDQLAHHPWLSVTGERYHFRDDLGDIEDEREGGVATKTHIPAPEASDDDREVVAGPKARELIEGKRIDPKEPIWVGYDPESHGFREAGLKLSQAFRHIWISGVTGSGKTTWLVNYMCQLAFAGYGFLYVDPKGADSRGLMSKLPDERKDDVIVIDPADVSNDRVVSMNPLDLPDHVREDPAELQKEISRRISDLEAIFAGDEYWGVNMSMIIQILGRAMMLSSRDYTIIDMFFILLSHERMENFADSVDDDFIRDAINTMVLEMEPDEIRPTIKRLLNWVLDGLIRRIISQRESSVDWREVIDENQIVILRTAIDNPDIKRMMTLSVMRGITSAVVTRADEMDVAPPPYFAIFDEFDAVASDQLDIPEVLARARSSRLSVTVTCQHPSQLSEDVVKALKNNAKNRIIFTSEDKDDAKVLMETFDPYDADDLLKTDDYRAWTKLPLPGGETSQPICPRAFAPYPQLRPMGEVDQWVADSLEEHGIPVLTDDEIRDQLPHNAGAEFDVILEAARNQFGADDANMAAGDGVLDAESGGESPEDIDAVADDLADDLLGRSTHNQDAPTPYAGADPHSLVAEAVLDEAIARGMTTDGKLPTDQDPDRPDWRIDVDQDLVERVTLYTRGRISTLPELNHAIDEVAGDLIAKDAVDDGREIRTTSKGRNLAFLSGDKMNSGNGPHRDLAEDAYLLWTRLGLEMTVVSQGGGADVDMLGLLRQVSNTDYSDVPAPAAARVARKRFERLQQNHPSIAWATDGSDVTGELECSTGSTKNGQTVINLAKAYNMGQVCLFIARPDVARKVWNTLTNPPMVKRASTEDVTVFYNIKKVSIGGEIPVIPNADRVRWSYDHGREEYILADTDGTVHARFEDHDAIFSDLDAYPRSTADYDAAADDPALSADGPDLTVAMPVIPDRLFDADGGVDGENLPTPDDFRVLAIEPGAGTAWPPKDPLDAIQVVDDQGERSLRVAAGITNADPDPDPATNVKTDDDPEPRSDTDDLRL